jgi:hypothetical protein
MATLYLRPNANGDVIQLFSSGATYNWDCVDDVTPDDDVTFVGAPDVGVWYKDLYQLQDTTIGGTINWIKVWVRCYGSSGNQGNTTLRTYNRDYDGNTISLTTTWTNYYTQYNTNPYTGSAWTWAEINALQAGVRLYLATSKSTAWCTQVYIEVDYTPRVYYWSGSSWVGPTAIKYWTGSAWQDVSGVYYWNGSSWVRVW